MYVVSVNGKEVEVEAKGLTVESGMLIFFADEASTESNFIVTPGKWDYIKVKDGSLPIRIRKPAEAPVVEEKENATAEE